MVRIEASSAGAELQATGEADPLRVIIPGEPLPARFDLKTVDAPLRLLLSDGTRIVLGPHSRLGRTGTLDVALPGSGRFSADHLTLLAGELSAETPSSAQGFTAVVSSFGVLTALLPGGQLRARIQPKEVAPRMVSLAVDRGEARFLTRGAWKTLPAGRAVDAVAGQPALTTNVLPAPPPWPSTLHACRKDDCSIAVVFSDGSTAPLALSWDEPPGALGYTFELARDPAFKEVIERHETTTRSADLMLAPGRYFARTIARGAAHIPSLPSTPRELRVIRAVLPAGTSARDGRWLLPRGREIELKDAPGLELAVGPIGFVSAPPRIGLARQVALSARLRVAGAPDYTELQLQPATLRADIEMSPRNAVWPYDPIDLRVRMADPGSLVPPTFTPRLMVCVDDVEVALKWQKESAGVYRTRLDPRLPPGPWVVRVEARDPYDNEIGRAFMEVSSPRR